MMPTRFRILMVSDILIAGSYGLIMPILPLFMVERVSGTNLQTVAVAQAIYLLSQAGFSWVFGSYQQHKQLAKRSHGGLVVGSIIVTLVPIIYLFSRDISQIFLAQLLLGLGFGLIYPAWTWMAKEEIQEQHLKSVKKIYDVVLSLALAFMAVAGGFVAYRYGFHQLLMLMSALGLCGTVLAISLWYDHIKS